MLEAPHPSLKKMYSPSDGIMDVFYLSEAHASFHSFNTKPEVEELYRTIFMLSLAHCCNEPEKCSFPVFTIQPFAD